MLCNDGNVLDHGGRVAWVEKVQLHDERMKDTILMERPVLMPIKVFSPSKFCYRTGASFK